MGQKLLAVRPASRELKDAVAAVASMQTVDTAFIFALAFATAKAQVQLLATIDRVLPHEGTQPLD
jgi:hypothetical protein